MDIRMLELISGARKAEGLAVIIDVFRAFSTECYLFDRGVTRIYPIGEMETAFAMKKAHPDYVLFGERGGARVEGCDFGNSPFQLGDYDFKGKCVIHTTSAGTQGIVNAAAAGAEEIVTASLVNAKAVASYIQAKNPEIVSIVAMGKAGKASAGEDVLCAQYIKACLEQRGETFDIRSKARALQNTAAKHFFNPATQEVYPKEDFYLCTDCDRFDFVIKVGRDSSGSLITYPLHPMIY